MYVCMNVCMYICICMWMSVWAYILTWVNVCVSVWARVHANSPIYMRCNTNVPGTQGAKWLSQRKKKLIENDVIYILIEWFQEICGTSDNLTHEQIDQYIQYIYIYIYICAYAYEYLNTQTKPGTKWQRITKNIFLYIS